MEMWDLLPGICCPSRQVVSHGSCLSRQVSLYNWSFQYSLGHSPDLEELRKELDVWRRSYIDVDSLKQELFDVNSRNSYLRQEIDRLQNTLKVNTAQK